jgi:O-antigen ligase
MKVLRFALLLLIAFAVLSFGAVEVWSQSILEAGAALLLVIWALIARLDPQAKIRWNPLNWPLLGLVAIAALQLLLHGTASAFLTRTELLRLAAYFIVFFLIAQAFRSRKDWSRLAWFVICFGFAVSLLAIMQHFTSKQEIYWMHRFRTDVEPFGPYVNRDDFAGFVELTLPVGVALILFRGVHKDLIPLLTLLTVVPVSAVVLSSSRGGIMSVAFEMGVLFLLAMRGRNSSRKGRHLRAVAIGMAALVAIVFVAWIGAGRAIQRFSSLSNPEVSLSRRVSMGRGALRIFFAHPIKGCGLGALVDVFPLYDTGYDGRIVDHVHDDYLEALAEAGVLGGICGLGFLWLLYREGRKNLEAEQGHFSRALHAGAIAAVCGLLLHSFVDFNLHIPANALLFLLQVSIVASPPLPPASAPRVHRPGLNAERLGHGVSVS